MKQVFIIAFYSFCYSLTVDNYSSALGTQFFFIYASMPDRGGIVFSGCLSHSTSLVCGGIKLWSANPSFITSANVLVNVLILNYSHWNMPNIKKSNSAISTHTKNTVTLCHSFKLCWYKGQANKPNVIIGYHWKADLCLMSASMFTLDRVSSQCDKQMNG